MGTAVKLAAAARSDKQGKYKEAETKLDGRTTKRLRRAHAARLFLSNPATAASLRSCGPEAVI